ncbi:pyrroloquinoline quinone biosynthesis protein PqqB [Nonomuraea angiospora]|uniref:Coenzyme PQQ synthesis protein B n=1 Tax=Nonomuraea angiospora TaxID=46172 RepID=A0ABR9M7U9_9ACTN|nr:MBL fold metallo-hydrolase [Nonomuraea angiospora]MBE1588401.1 pyrroloquinoline quinone biosynthesis protein B [Nonomuraea angiospora]
MRLQVLGTAAGGGVPQWNCACPGCSGARAHPGRRRRHASLAVQLDDGAYVVNATPDIAEQIESCAWLRPGPGPRESPLKGVILTDAELDHTIGLLRLREADALEVRSTPVVRHALRPFAELLRPYLQLTWAEAAAIPVSGKRPRYAADSPEVEATGWVSALRLGPLVYAPAMGVWPDELDEAFRQAECVIVDGTFWDDEEPRRTGISARTATQMGHLPIEATMERLSKLPGRRLYTHLNNTNPLVDPAAEQHEVLAELGIEVAADGMVIDL